LGDARVRGQSVEPVGEDGRVDQVCRHEGGGEFVVFLAACGELGEHAVVRFRGTVPAQVLSLVSARPRAGRANRLEVLLRKR